MSGNVIAVGVVIAAVFVILLGVLSDLRAHRKERERIETEGEPAPSMPHPTSPDAPRLAAIDEVRPMVSEYDVPPSPVGYWEVWPGMNVASFTRPSRWQQWTHRTFFGWKWRDAE